jgi:hypothetical protein
LADAELFALSERRQFPPGTPRFLLESSRDFSIVPLPDDATACNVEANGFRRYHVSMLLSGTEVSEALIYARAEPPREIQQAVCTLLFPERGCVCRIEFDD